MKLSEEKTMHVARTLTATTPSSVGGIIVTALTATKGIPTLQMAAKVQFLLLFNVLYLFFCHSHEVSSLVPCCKLYCHANLLFLFFSSQSLLLQYMSTSRKSIDNFCFMKILLNISLCYVQRRNYGNPGSLIMKKGLILLFLHIRPQSHKAMATVIIIE